MTCGRIQKSNSKVCKRIFVPSIYTLGMFQVPRSHDFFLLIITQIKEFKVVWLLNIISLKICNIFATIPWMLRGLLRVWYVQYWFIATWPSDFFEASHSWTYIFHILDLTIHISNESWWALCHASGETDECVAFKMWTLPF